MAKASKKTAKNSSKKVVLAYSGGLDTSVIIPWLKENKSQNSFAKNHDIEESTVRKIKSDTTYRIPVETLYKICKSRKITLEEFFKLIDE